MAKKHMKKCSTSLIIQFSSVAQSCPTLCDPMNRSTPGLSVHQKLLESTQTHIHWVGDAIQPSYPLSSPSPLALNLSQHRDLFKWVSSMATHSSVLAWRIPRMGEPGGRTPMGSHRVGHDWSDSSSSSSSSSSHQVAKVLEFQLQHHSFQWTPRTDLL